MMGCGVYTDRVEWLGCVCVMNHVVMYVFQYYRASITTVPDTIEGRGK